MFRMQIYIIAVLLLYSGAVRGGLEKMLRLAEYFFYLFRTANLQSTPSGAISKCEVRDNGRE